MIDPLIVARQTSAELGVLAWLVGGRLRDSILGRVTLDTDIAVAGDAWQFAARAAARAAGRLVRLHREPDIGRVVWRTQQGWIRLDVAALVGRTIEEDLRRRDFTVNALAAAVQAELPPSQSEIIDPTGGLDDLRSRTLRLTHAGALLDDPLRLLRGPRLAAELGFQLHPETASSITLHAPAIATIAPERVRDELVRLIAVPAPAEQVRQLDRLGLLDPLLPELLAGRGVRQSPPHERDVYEHGLAVMAAVAEVQQLVERGTGPLAADPWQQVLEPYAERLAAWLAQPMGDGVPRGLWLRLAGLLHDIGKPVCMTVEPGGRIRFRGHETESATLAAAIAHRLRLANASRAYLLAVIRNHGRPRRLAAAEITRRAIFRYFRSTGDVGVDVALHALADALGKSHGRESVGWPVALVVRRLLQAWFDERETVVSPPPLLRGDEIIAALGLTPGPRVGRLLEAMVEAQAAGELASKAQALQFVGRLHHQMEE